MTALAAIAVTDGKPSPDTHTFNPARSEPGLLTYHADVSSGIALGFEELTLGNRLPNSANRNHKVVIKLRVPVLETAATAASGFTPGPRIAYHLMGKVEFVIPDRATAQEREDLRVVLWNTLANTQIVSVVEDMSMPY